MLDLEPIRARFAKVEAIAKEESPSEYRLVAVHAHSAMDVPALIAEVERLRDAASRWETYARDLEDDALELESERGGLS